MKGEFKVVGKQVLIQPPKGKKGIKQSKVIKTGQRCKYINNGDIIFYDKKNISTFVIGSNKYHILKEEDILGKKLIQKQRHTKIILCAFIFTFLFLSTDILEVDDFDYEMSLPETTIEGKPIYNVAIYDDSGVLNDQIYAFISCINKWEDINYDLINTQQLLEGHLYDFDLILIAGGMAIEESQSLGFEGKEQILNFVLNGGGYFGVCAGAYLALSGEPYAIPLLNAQTVSKNWIRGFSMINVELTDAGRQFFGEVENIVIGYNNGPIIENYGDLYERGYETLAYLRDGIGMNNYEAKIMINTPAIARALKGEGRVIIMNIHPEKISQYHFFVRKIIYWLCGV